MGQENFNGEASMRIVAVIIVTLFTIVTVSAVQI